MRKFLLLLVLLLCVAGVALLYAPWHSLLEGQIRKVLQARGFTDVSLRVVGIDTHGVILEDLQLGRDAPLRFKNVHVSYNLQDLRHFKLKDLTLVGPSLILRQRMTGTEAQGWIIEGAESFFEAGPDAPPMMRPARSPP